MFNQDRMKAITCSRLNKRRQTVLHTLQITIPTTQDILTTNGCLPSFPLLKPAEEIKTIYHGVGVFLTCYVMDRPPIIHVILVDEKQIET